MPLLLAITASQPPGLVKLGWKAAEPHGVRFAPIQPESLPCLALPGLYLIVMHDGHCCTNTSGLPPTYIIHYPGLWEI